MLSFEFCHFCDALLYDNSCFKESCLEFEYQVYPDINLIDFYIKPKYCYVEYKFNEDRTPKEMNVVDCGSTIVHLNCHIEINQFNYEKFIHRISELEIVR